MWENWGIRLLRMELGLRSASKLLPTVIADQRVRNLALFESSRLYSGVRLIIVGFGSSKLFDVCILVGL